MKPNELVLCLPKGFNVDHARDQLNDAITTVKKDKNLSNTKELVALMKCAMETIPNYPGRKFMFYIDRKGVKFELLKPTKGDFWFYFAYTRRCFKSEEVKQ